jgi:peptide/nickel transport system substrate-binding protein
MTTNVRTGENATNREPLAQIADSTLTRRQTLKGALALGLAAPAARAFAGSASAQDAASTLTIAMNGSPSDLDPHSAYDYRSAIAIRGPYETLIGLVDNKTDVYEGVIAEKWEPNADKSVWTFHIRDGVTFHDGSACDAEAVRASFERFLTLGLGPVNVIARFITDPAKITAPDAKTVVFDLGKPQPLFEAAISSQYGPLIINAKAAKAQEDNGDWGHAWVTTNEEGLGTGPFKITTFDPEQQLIMERYDNYWKGWDGNHFDGVTIRVVPENETRRQLIERGEADIIDNLTPEALQALEQNADLFIDKSYSTEVDYLMMTVTGPLKSKEARQAMCYAFPYDDVITGVYKGYGKRAIGPVAELCRGFAKETFQYTTDLDKAKALFAQAGVAEGTELSLTEESGDQNVISAVQLFQANLDKIGIKLNIETTDLTNFTSIVFGDAPPEERPMVMPWFWWPDYNDAWDHLDPQVRCSAAGSAGTNSGFYCNQQVDDLMLEARDAPDETSYNKALADVQQILSQDDPPAIYYKQGMWTTILRKEIQGFLFNPIYIGTYNYYKLNRAG